MTSHQDLRNRLAQIVLKLDRDDAIYVLRALDLLNPCEECGLARVEQKDRCGCAAQKLIDEHLPRIERGLD
jgi:hypothetical protein